MNQPEVIRRLQSIFDTLFLDDVVVTPELSAAQVPEWDSLKHVSLVLAVEREFGIRFRVGEVESAKCIGDFANLILKRMS